MQLDRYLAQVHDQITAAAALGDERTRDVAITLAAATTPSVRLAILTAVSEAAEEITASLLDYPGSPAVTVRLLGDELHVAVQAAEPDASTAETRRDEGDTSARISLRLSESLKSDIDDAASHEGVSVNTWLVRTASAALNPWPSSGQSGRGGARRGNPHNADRRVTGWING